MGELSGDYRHCTSRASSLKTLFKPAFPLQVWCRGHAPFQPTPQETSPWGSESKSRWTPFNMLLNRPSEIPWASVAQPPILAPIDSFIESYHLLGGGHIPPLKSPSKGWKVHADPHATATVGKLLPAREALKPRRPGSVGQALPAPRAPPQDLLFRRPPFRLRSHRPRCGEPEILSLIGRKNRCRFGL